MPTQHTVTSYKFSELSDEAKETAREWYRRGALDYEWWDGVYDDAARVFLKITGFDLGRGHECTAKFTRSAIETARAIVKDHGEGTETRKLAEEYLEGGKTTVDWLCTGCGYDNAHERTACRDCGEEKTGDEDLDWENAEDTNREFLRNLCGAYWDILNTEYEYRLSDECVDEDIEANEYDFDANGNRFRY